LQISIKFLKKIDVVGGRKYILLDNCIVYTAYATEEKLAQMNWNPFSTSSTTQSSTQLKIIFSFLKATCKKLRKEVIFVEKGCSAQVESDESDIKARSKLLCGLSDQVGEKTLDQAIARRFDQAVKEICED
jgi:hypothetical protein